MEPTGRMMFGYIERSYCYGTLRTVYDLIALGDIDRLENVLAGASSDLPALDFEELVSDALIFAVEKFNLPAVQLLLHHGACPNMTLGGERIEAEFDDSLFHDEDDLRANLNRMLQSSLLYAVISAKSSDEVDSEIRPETRRAIARSLICHGAVTCFIVRRHRLDLFDLTSHAIENDMWPEAIEFCRLGILPLRYLEAMLVMQPNYPPPEHIRAFLAALHDPLNYVHELISNLVLFNRDLGIRLELVSFSLLILRESFEDEDYAPTCTRIMELCSSLQSNEPPSLSLSHRAIRALIKDGSAHSIVTERGANIFDGHELFDIVCLSETPPPLPLLVAWLQFFYSHRDDEDALWHLVDVMWQQCLPREEKPKRGS